MSFVSPVLDPDEFDRIYEPLDVKSKKIHVVDSGLTYNLPYPLLLRPQRTVDLIISFDFSARPSDTSPPFKVFSFVTCCLKASAQVSNHQSPIIRTIFALLFFIDGPGAPAGRKVGSNEQAPVPQDRSQSL